MRLLLIFLGNCTRGNAAWLPVNSQLGYRNSERRRLLFGVEERHPPNSAGTAPSVEERFYGERSLRQRNDGRHVTADKRRGFRPTSERCCVFGTDSWVI